MAHRRLVREQAAELPGAASRQRNSPSSCSSIYCALISRLPELWRQDAPAISDPRIAPALRLMHRDPGVRGGQGARQGGAMSARLRLHFRQSAGIAPLATLTNGGCAGREVSAPREHPVPRSRAHLATRPKRVSVTPSGARRAGHPNYRTKRGQTLSVADDGVSP